MQESMLINCGECSAQISDKAIACPHCGWPNSDQSNLAVEVARAVKRHAVPGEIICPNPNCGYIGKPSYIRRGSLGVGCLLAILFLIPGMIYIACTDGYRLVCPNCGAECGQKKSGFGLMVLILFAGIIFLIFWMEFVGWRTGLK
jgi:hypothetical protein